MLSVVAVQSTKISFFGCMGERDEGEDRVCLSSIACRAFVSIAIVYQAWIYIACVGLAGDCRVSDCGVARLKKLLHKMPQLRELFGGVLHGNACTKLFHMLKCWSRYRFNNVIFYDIIVYFSDILLQHIIMLNLPSRGILLIRTWWSWRFNLLTI